VDVNRAGTPLMEIVSEPDIRSAEEARLYLTNLQQILRYLGVSRANMDEGNMRCEPNVSLRPLGQTEFGSKVELKNLNSFRVVVQAIEYEIERQSGLLNAGERVAQETRGWREEGHTASQRSKEFDADYRYFPEPDLPSMSFSQTYVEGLRSRLPELPSAKRRRFGDQYDLSPYEANLLTVSRARADFFEQAVAESGDDAQAARQAKAVANWMIGDFARLLNASSIDISESKVQPKELHALIVLIEEGTITTTGAKSVFEEMFDTGKSPRAIVEEQGLTQISAADELTTVIAQVIDGNPKPVADFRGGKDEAMKFLVGQVMRETRGRAKPDLVQELLRKALT
jgi:aspartyl-tRNA(Asn)/glutamyl-tRNA(Gln) amidotransferase subunit B